MSAKIPKSAAESQLSSTLATAGLHRIHQGKVRDTYAIPDRDDLLLVVATNRLSIFDFVLNCLVPTKGEVLTYMTIFWLTGVLESIPNHLVAWRSEIERYLPKYARGNGELHDGALVVRKHEVLPIECIVRGYLTGSGWRDYKATGKVCGIELPPGLHDGSRLEFPIFTPSTKAEVGHDENIDADGVEQKYGRAPGSISCEIYRRARVYAEPRGVIIADTKFELSTNRVLVDEVLTPDSSRFWDKEEWSEANKAGKSPSGFDKEPVRQWGLTLETPFSDKDGRRLKFNQLSNENPEHLEYVAGIEVPDEVVFDTARRYQAILQKLTGRTLSDWRNQ